MPLLREGQSLFQHSLNSHSDCRHSVVSEHRVLGEHFTSNLNRRPAKLLRALMKVGMTVQIMLQNAPIH